MFALALSVFIRRHWALYSGYADGDARPSPGIDKNFLVAWSAQIVVVDSPAKATRYRSSDAKLFCGHRAGPKV
jgi:hypothetical protein